MIFPFLISAIAFGFLGSFHCVGMCGPIALSLPVQHLNGGARAVGIGLYNLGRIVMYAIIGIIFGVIGLSFQYFGWQQYLSIALGIALLILFIIRIVPQNAVQKFSTFSKWNQWVIQFLAPLMQSPKKRNLLLVGMLNGLLPCGLIYLALAGAMATGNIFYSGLFMAGFGAGTLPAMVLASYAAGLITLQIRNKIKRALPYMLLLMGILLILRGMNLEIPFLSPVLHQNSAVQCP